MTTATQNIEAPTTIYHGTQRLEVVDIPTLADYEANLPSLAKYHRSWVMGFAKGSRGAFYSFLYNWSTSSARNIRRVKV
jgi:hypothetical protein